METLRPKLRFPKFKIDWENRRLGEFTQWASGGTPPKDNLNFWNGDIPWISASSMRGLVYTNSELKITPAGLKKGSKLAKKGGLLLLVRGSMLFNKIPIGIAGIDVSFNQDLKSISVDNNVSNSKYILHWFFYSEPKILNMVTGTGIGAGKLDLSDLKELNINIPSLEEQTKIANFLSAIDEKLNLLKEKKSLLEDYKKGIMQKIFNQEIRFKDDNGDDFEDWEEKNFISVLKSLPTKKHQIQSSDISKEGKYPVIDQGKKRVAGFSDSLNNLYKDYPVIVFGDHTTILKYIDFDFIVGADGTKLLKNLNNDNLKYLYYNLIYNNVEQEGYKRHFSILSEISLQIPSFREQTKIANFLSAIDEKIDLVSNQIQDTQEYKKGLLQQMFV